MPAPYPGFGVKRLAKLHDIHPVLTQRGTNGRAWICLASRDLQLYVASIFLAM